MANLFDAAAERLAMADDIPLSQARLRVAGKEEAPSWYCLCGRRLELPLSPCECGK